MEKAFDKVPQDVMWWEMHKLDIENWLASVAQAMYTKARSPVQVNGTHSEEFVVKVGVHKGSVLSPLLFIMVLEALPHEFRSEWCPQELLYADNHLLIGEILEMEKRYGDQGTLDKYEDDKNNSDCETGSVSSGRWPCSVCKKGVGRNSYLL